ncbi:MAG: IscS subfamily cysteine desulfurase [Terriglobia bacterium]
MKLPIYLDHHATTPVDPQVLEAMLPYFAGKFGNAASHSHRFGWEAREAVETARGQLGRLIRARPEEIIFTSGATESNNLALKGVAGPRGNVRRHVVTLATEHKSVLDPCRRLEAEGCDVTTLGVRRDGLIDLTRLRGALRPDTALVSVMAAHNETGVIQPIAEIGRLCRERGILFHTDAAQAAGKIPLDAAAMNVDLMSLSAHKIYGPKGVGALYLRRQAAAELAPLLDGGGHESGLRSGTLNVPGIVGFGAACAIAEREMAEESARLSALRDRLLSGIRARLDDVYLNGDAERRLPHNLNLSFAHAEAAKLVMSLPEIALSTGSACTSARPEPSYVLRAMGVPDELADSALRFGLGRFTTAEEIDYTAGRIADAVTALRSLAVTPQ